MFGEKPRNLVPVPTDETKGSGRRYRSRSSRRRSRLGWRGELRSLWRTTSNPRDHRRFRPGIVRWTAIGLLLLVGGGLALHGWQLGRTRAALFAKADAAKAAGDLVAARQWLERCVLIDPSDHEAMLRLLSLTGPNSSLIEQRHALALAESVLKRWPDRVDLRARVAELNVVDSPGVALSEAEEVLKLDPREPTALRVRALARDVAQIGPSTPLELVAAVIDDYRRASESSPDDLLTAFRRATLARLHAEGLARREGLSPEQFEFKADAIVDGIVAKSDGPRARLGRYLYRLRFLDPASGPEESEEIEADLRAAVGLAPNDADLRLVLAEKLVRHDLTPDRARDSEVARTMLSHLTLARGGRGSDPRIYLGIADIFWLQRETDQAIATLEAGIAEVGDWAIDLLARLATFRVARGEWDKAVTALARAEDLLTRTRHRYTHSEQDELMATVVLARAAWLLDPRSPARNPYVAVESLQAIEKGDCRPETLYAIAFTLGRVLLEMSAPGEALGAFLRARAIAPANVGPRLGLARAHEDSGQWQAAADAYEELAIGASGNPTPEERAEAWFGLGRARIALARGCEPGDTRWLAADRAIAEYRSTFPDSFLPPFLEVERAVGMGESTESLDARAATESLRAAEARFDGKVGFWRLALDVYVRLGQWEAVERAIDRVEALTGAVDQGARDRLEIERGMESREGSDAARAQRARRAWRSILDAQVALGESDAAGIEEIANAMEGSDPLATALRDYFHVLGLIARQAAGATLGHAEARSASRALLSRRPWWNLAHHAAGLLAESRGDRMAAIRAYQVAVRLGDDGRLSSRRLLCVLARAQKWSEACRLLEESPADFSLHPEILPLTLLAHARVGEGRAALALAQQAVAARPNDSETHVLLGIAALGVGDESARGVAARAFRSAVELDPASLRAWLGLLYFHVARDEPGDLPATLDALRGSLALLGSMTGELSQPVRAILVGCGLEFGGQWLEADTFFFRMREPGEPDVSQAFPRPLAPLSLARWWPPSNLPHAINPARLPAAVQRMVGLVVLAGDETEKDSAAWLGTDQGLAALVSLGRGGPIERGRAAELLSEELVRGAESERGEELLLARLLRLQGPAERALGHYRGVARRASEESSPAAARAGVLAECVEYFIEANQLGDAAACFATLERKAPSPEPVRLRLTLLAAQGNEESCLAAAEAYLGSAQGGERLHRARQLHAWLGHGALGARLFDRLRSRLESVGAGEYLVADMAVADGRGGAAREALALCQALYGNSVDWPAAWLAARLLARDTWDAGDTGTADRAAIESRLEAIANSLAANPSLAGQWIQLLALRRRVPEALARSEELARHFPRDASVAAQGLLLLVDDPDLASTALPRADDAIRRHGPLPRLLDAKAMILVARGRPEEALPLLEANATVAAASPLALLHLAEAYRQAGHLASARATSARLKDLAPLDLADLSLSDRSALRDLRSL